MVLRAVGGYIVQVICVSQMCEKYFANGKDEIWAFMALKMVYDTIDRPACQMYRMRGVGGKSMEILLRYYVECTVCVTLCL